MSGATFASALQSREFRLLWASQTTSVVGDALVLVAVGLFVTELTGKPSDVGLVLAAYSVPLIFVLMVGGVVADRMPRHLVMVATDVARCVLHGALALLIATGEVAVWHMLVIGVLYGVADAFFRPAYAGLVPQTVDDAQIQSAQALSRVSHEVARFVSPAIATALVLGVGGAAAFALDAATFAVSAALLLKVRAHTRVQPSSRLSFTAELRDGWGAVRARTWVWATIAGFALAIFFALAPFFVLGATVAEVVYGGSAVFGLANVAWGAGTVLGAVLGARWTPVYPMRAGMTAAVWWPLAIAIYASGPPLPVVVAVLAAAGVGTGLLTVWWETALAMRIPPHLLSRVSAWDWMGSLALVPAGYALAGPAGEALGASNALVLGGLLGTAAMLAAATPRSTRYLSWLTPDRGPSGE